LFNLREFFKENIINLMELHLYEKGEIIYNSGMDINYFYLLVEGKLKVYYLTESGRIFQVDFSEPLDLLGDLEFLNSKVSQHYVESIERSVLIGIPMERLKKEVESDAEFFKFMCRFLSRKLSKTSQTMLQGFMYPLKNRFATYIHKLIPKGENVIYNFKVGQTADILGTSPRHLSRIIKEFSEVGVLKKDGSKLIILDYKNLCEFVIKQ
jgi:CRP/FNR family putative post-exponential-phase nitrogen-starvation transcriptional regulator